MKVLLIEDHPGMAKVSCDLLSQLYGHDVRHVVAGGAIEEWVASQIERRVGPEAVSDQYQLAADRHSPSA